MSLQLFTSAVLATATVCFAAARRPLPALVTAIAAVAYFTMYRALQQQQQKPLHPQHQQPPQLIAARYADWLLTTPLILFMLLRDVLPGPWLAFVCGADVMMIATGYLGVSEATPAGRRAWFALSCALFVPVVYALGTSLMTRRTRTRSWWAAVLSLAIWLAYPIVWFAQYCVPAIGPETANAITAALDVTAKVGFGLLIGA